MNRRHTALLAFAAALASGGITVSAQASDVNVAHAMPSHAASALHDRALLPRAYTRDHLLALSTAELIYMHESLAGSLVSMTPAAFPAPPAVPQWHKTAPAVQK